MQRMLKSNIWSFGYKAIKSLKRRKLMEKTLEVNNYVLEESVKDGSVKIADDVIAMIAGIAATEVEGVASTAGNVGNNILSYVGVNTLAQGVRTEITGSNVKVNVAIIVEYGHNIPTVSAKVQEKVKQTVESMTALNVTDVNVKVAGVNIKGK